MTTVVHQDNERIEQYLGARAEHLRSQYDRPCRF